MIQLEALREKLEQTYELEHFELDIGGRVYGLAVVKNTDELLDKLIARGPGDPAFDDDQIAYWAELWHAAIGMAEFIEGGHVVGEGQSVLEIGCGIGLCGIAAAFQGAEVVLTDYLPEALQLAEYNWYLNHPDKVVDCRLLDWREPKPEWKADVLIASDVAYEDRSHEPLMRVFKEMVAKGGRAWLSEPGRSFTQSWLSQLTKEEFLVNKNTIFVNYQGIKSKVGIYSIQL